MNSKYLLRCGLAFLIFALGLYVDHILFGKSLTEALWSSLGVTVGIMLAFHWLIWSKQEKTNKKKS